MSRPVRDRVGMASATSITCPTCAKRLLLAQPDDDGHVHRGVDAVKGLGVQWVAGARRANGVKFLAHEDWHSITCGRCHAEWQVREAKLRALVDTYPGQAVSLHAPAEVVGPLWQNVSADHLDRLGRHDDAVKARGTRHTREW